jgi:prepilin-type N-terminal cleavage/methylation domain-containing protein
MATPKRTTRGFTLVELAVVVVIIGVLAAFGVPRFMNSVERSKAAEAFNFLSTVASAQERTLARDGSYCNDLSDLDIELEDPEYFTVGDFSLPKGIKSYDTGWQLTLTRSGSAGKYGAYTVVWDQTGFDSKNSTIDSDISPYKSK